MSEIHNLTRTVVILRDPYTGEYLSYIRTYHSRPQTARPCLLPKPIPAKPSESPSLLQKTVRAAGRMLSGSVAAFGYIAMMQAVESKFVSGQMIGSEQLLTQNNLLTAGVCGVAAMLCTHKASEALSRGLQFGAIADASRLIHSGRAAEMLQAASLKAQTLWQNFCSGSGERICNVPSWVANKMTTLGCELAQKTGRLQEALCPARDATQSA